MRVRFTKMQGAGNDFVVLDATRAPIRLDRAQRRALADRRFGIGCDQILVVGPPRDRAVADFSYRIYNADGGEVEQCGNGARAFARFVRDRGLSDARSIRVETAAGVIVPTIGVDGDVTVDMGAPCFAEADVAFDARGLAHRDVADATLWSIDVPGGAVEIDCVSMGNPHAVVVVADVEGAPVGALGPALEHHRRFAHGVNAGFVEVVDRGTVQLRVHERGAGETLACGTGACAAVVSGIRRGLLDADVTVRMRGGDLRVRWGGSGSPVLLGGPAVPVFEGEIVVADPTAIEDVADVDVESVIAEPHPS